MTLPQTLTFVLPLAGALIFYLLRIESRLAAIETDIKWIKTNSAPCKPTSEDHMT